MTLGTPCLPLGVIPAVGDFDRVSGTLVEPAGYDPSPTGWRTWLPAFPSQSTVPNTGNSTWLPTSHRALPCVHWSPSYGQPMVSARFTPAQSLPPLLPSLGTRASVSRSWVPFSIPVSYPTPCRCKSTPWAPGDQEPLCGGDRPGQCPGTC